MTDIPYHAPLTTDSLRNLGIPEPWTIGFADRVRFTELDPLGHVNNAAYLSWFENFRLQYMDFYGAPLTGRDAYMVVLRQVQVDYLGEMKLGDDYVVTGRTTVLRTSSFQMEYAVWSGGALRTTSTAVLVMVNEDGKCPIPPKLRSILTTRDGAISA
ncbi:thioesterase family protein [uncultured Litoreibacter sp.]|uniref:acyl-CoA thioesterase n=1 Tax=uncultured Litoreibacter sp. TaxID=1392394 RepID=UPI00260DF254|nr:thioesterase family protein [uncultured Litoreibacter sp.]